MFDFLKRRKAPLGPPPAPLSLTMREFLYGDMPPEVFPPAAATSSDPGPGGLFAAARDALAGGRKEDALQLYRAILHFPDLESRLAAQAWTALRHQGIQPGPADFAVYGAIAEAGVNGGLDIVAAYADGTARYFNYSNGSVIWEAPGTDPLISAAIEATLDAARRVAGFAGVHDGPRPGPVLQGIVRITAICPDGLHFGEGPLDIFQSDAVAGPFVAAALKLMEALMERSSKAEA